MVRLLALVLVQLRSVRNQHVRPRRTIDGQRRFGREHRVANHPVLSIAFVKEKRGRNDVVAKKAKGSKTKWARRRIWSTNSQSFSVISRRFDT